MGHYQQQDLKPPTEILPIEMSLWVLDRFLWDNATLTELGAGLAAGKINRCHQNELNLGNYKHLKVLICMIILYTDVQSNQETTCIYRKITAYNDIRKMKKKKKSLFRYYI